MDVQDFLNPFRTNTLTAIRTGIYSTIHLQRSGLVSTPPYTYSNRDWHLLHHKLTAIGSDIYSTIYLQRSGLTSTAPYTYSDRDWHLLHHTLTAIESGIYSTIHLQRSGLASTSPCTYNDRDWHLLHPVALHLLRYFTAIRANAELVLSVNDLRVHGNI